ncbi:MAG TPA: NAD-dependent epimerase/dehydratase family protein [Bacteroidia bacterium]|nr:NAD-dependent epimerase/dehydratase family protein [Bacteroidia bacterium]
MKKDSKIFIAGHTGLVGSALVRKLNEEGYHNVITCSHSKLDLINQQDVDDFFEEPKHDINFNN